ncbi:MAG TPA: glycosyltransferase, partial [Nitrospira sp.]
MTRRKLKLGVDARSLLCRHPRGEGKSLLRLYQEIRRLRPDIEIIFYGDSHARNFSGDLPEGIRVSAQDPPGNRFSTWENLYFPVAAKLAGCNVLHCTSSGGPVWSPQAQILTIHDLIPLCFDDGWSDELKGKFRKRLEHGLRNARAIITVSAHTKKDLLRQFPVLRKPVHVIHWGSDQTQADNHYSSGTERTPYLIAFGGEAKRKNTLFALERFFAIAPLLPDVKLQMIGINNLKQRAEILSLCERKGMTDRVLLPGFVSEAD